MNELNLERRLDQIWENYQNIDNEILSRMYCYPITSTIKKDAILFVGLNPSFTEKDEKKVSNYPLSSMNNTHAYFKKIEKLNTLEFEWTHLDLLYLRETSSKKVKNLLKIGGADFIYEQLQLTKQIIENINPKIIIVANTLSRMFFGFDKDPDNIKPEKRNLWLNYNFKFDEDLGTHRIISEGSLKDKPVFFTSMLSGQRAIDNGSFERLKWHIKFVINKLNDK